MIRIRIERTKEGVIQGFSVSGHAEYREHGQDIICAAVSALAIATANGLMNEHVELEDLQVEEGRLQLTLGKSLSYEEKICARAILGTFVLGVEAISAEYGASYVTVEISTL